jgi:hypothetical protein
LGAEADCYQCHQGRASTVRVQEAIDGLAPDTVSEELGFINVHYYVAAATKQGDEVQGAYQYQDRDYVGYFEHTASYQICYDCHDPHSLDIDYEKCSPCHVKVSEPADVFNIRTDPVDYDGDGDTDEGIAYEILTFQELLYESIQRYAAEVIGTPIVYAKVFPYFMVDTDGDGEVDEGEANFGNRYTQWSPRLVRTAYNYQYARQDPGKHCHNPEYVLQMLYDSIQDLETWSPAEAANLVRPEGS